MHVSMHVSSRMLRIVLGTFVVVLLTVLVVYASHRGLSLQTLKTARDALLAHNAARPWQSAALFFLAYTVVAAFSLPVAALMTLAGGAVFGIVEGTLLVSFASTLGATLAMLVSRFLLRDELRRRGGARVTRVERKLQRDGAFYLFSLRLVPAVPFVLVNVVAGLAPIRVVTYWWVSQLGMLPATLVYVNAGQRLGDVSSLSGLLSPALVTAFLLLAGLPWLARWALEGWHRVCRRHASAVPTKRRS